MGATASCVPNPIAMPDHNGGEGDVALVEEKEGEVNYFVPKEHADILVTTWKDIQAFGVEKVGDIAFVGLFKRAPETFSMFTTFCDDPNWRSSPKFHHHCKVVVNIIGSFIKILTKAALVTSHLNYLGFQHNLRQITNKHFLILGEELLKAVEQALQMSNSWNDNARQAWGEFYTTVAAVMMKNMKMNYDGSVYIPKNMTPELPNAITEEEGEQQQRQQP